MKIKLFIWILLGMSYSYAFGKNLEGKVYDAQTKEPIYAATIQILNSHISTVTNLQGDFKLSISTEQQILKVSVVGYQTQEINISDQHKINIALEPNTSSLKEIIITANRESSLRREAPLAISKISAKTLEETKATALFEVINKIPGALMVNLNNEQHSMSIRQPMNTSAYYLYMEDGISIRPMGVFNHNALLEINQFSVSSIEVVKGPVSSIYGPEAVGGAVNFISQKPTAIPTIKAGIQFDQWGYKRFQFGAGARTGKFGFYIGGLSSKQNNSWMSASDYDKSTVNLRLEYHFTEKTRLIANSMYGKYHSQMSGAVDSTIFYNRAYVSNSDFAYRKSLANRSRLTIEQDWNKDSKTFFTLFNRFNEHGQNPNYGIRWNANVNPTTATGEINSNNFKSYGILSQHSQKFRFLNSKLITGALFDYSPNEYWSYQINLDAQLRPDGKSVEKYSIREERPDLKLADYDAKIKNAASYLQYDFEALHNLRFSTGIRYDLLSFTYNNYLDASSGKKEYSKITPKLGLTYDFGNDKGFYANYSQGFAPPALTAIFRKKPNTNPTEFYYNLESALFQNYELGAWASFWNNKIQIDFSIYQMMGENELLSIRQIDNSFDYQSAGKTSHKGIEFSLNIKPDPQFSFRWNATTAKHVFKDFQISNKENEVQNLAGFEMPSAPSWIWNSEFSYHPTYLSGFRSSLEWQYISEWYQNQINTVKYKGYQLLNFRTGYNFKGVEVFCNILNLTNALYASNVTRGNGINDRSAFNTAAPRTFVMGVQYNLSKNKH
jgi:iron complex outermembrane receptor protein